MNAHSDIYGFVSRNSWDNIEKVLVQINEDKISLTMQDGFNTVSCIAEHYEILEKDILIEVCDLKRMFMITF